MQFIIFLSGGIAALSFVLLLALFGINAVNTCLALSACVFVLSA